MADVTMEGHDRRPPSGVTAGKALIRRHWAQAIVRHHRDRNGACPVCSNGVSVAGWPCLPFQAAAIYLGRGSGIQ
jgi:hypothetical protein